MAPGDRIKVGETELSASQEEMPPPGLPAARPRGLTETAENIRMEVERVKRGLSMSPGKEDKDAKHVRFQDDALQGASAGSTGEGLPRTPRLPEFKFPGTTGMSPDQKLDYIINNMATQTQILQLETKIASIQSQIEEMTRKMIDTAIGPLKAELKRLNGKIEELEKQAGSKTSTGYDPSDPAFKRIEFLGFPDSMGHGDRIKQLDTFLLKFPSVRCTDIGSIYKGPYNNRSLSKKCYIELGSADAMKAAFEQMKDSELKIGGVKLRIRRGITKFNGQRNWALFKALELLEKENAKPALDMKARHIKVGDVIAFSQGKTDLKGSFHAPYVHLSIP